MWARESPYDAWKTTPPPESWGCEICDEDITEDEAYRTTETYNLQVCEGCERDLVLCINCQKKYPASDMCNPSLGDPKTTCNDCAFDPDWWK